MKFLKKAFEIVKRSFTLGFLFTLFFYLGSYIVKQTSYIYIVQLLNIYLFSFLLSFIWEIMYVKQIPLMGRITIHFVLSCLSFVIIFTLAGNIQKTFMGIFVMTLCYFLVYLFIAIILFFVFRKSKFYKEKIQFEKVEVEQTYTKRF